MIKNYLTQVRRLKGVLSEREAFVSRAAQATEAACIYEFVWIEQLIVRKCVWQTLYANVMFNESIPASAS